MSLSIFFLSCLLFSICYAAAQDFCVANYSAPSSPAGYSCKDPSQVNVTDFVFSLGTPGNTSNIFGIALTTAFADQWPGINGLGVTLTRIDLALGGVVPLHTHPRATEVIVVIEGKLLAGFIDNANRVYLEYLNVGDIMVFPQGLLHFQINVGPSSALAYVSFSNVIPGIYILDYSLFASDFPSDIIEKTVLLDHDEVKKLKGLFGGTG